MSSTLELSGQAVLWSVAPDERAAALASRPLLVLMHGRGSDENDLFALAPLLPPEAVVASLRAPLSLGPAYSWFSNAEPGLPSPLAAGDATEAVLRWLDRTGHVGATWLLGFSQGGAMVTQLLRFAPQRFEKFVNLAGFSIDGELPADGTLETLRPPLFWGRDPADPVIPQDAVERTAAWLPAHTTLTQREYRGIGHSISREEMNDVVAFLRG